MSAGNVMDGRVSGSSGPMTISAGTGTPSDWGDPSHHRFVIADGEAGRARPV